MSININAPETLHWRSALEDIEGKPDLVSEITTATVLMIQKRRSSTAHYKNRHSSAIRVTDEKHLTTNTYYSILSCMGGMLFLQNQNCHMAGCYINPWDLCCTRFRTKKEDMWDKIWRGNKATDATMFKKLPQWCWVKKQNPLSDLRWTVEMVLNVDSWRTFGTMIYPLKHKNGCRLKLHLSFPVKTAVLLYDKL